MVLPINDHVLIEPVKHQTFLPTEKGQYDEKGTVIALPVQFNYASGIHDIPEIGDTVFYDGWLASKFPGEKEDEYFWLVPLKDIKAIQKKDAV